MQSPVVSDPDRVESAPHLASFPAMGQALNAAFKNWAKSTALKDIRSDRRLTYSELGHLVASARDDLSRQGLQLGDSIATNLENGLELVVLILASLMSGFRLALIESQTPPSRLRYFCDLVAPKRVFFAAASLAGIDTGGVPFGRIPSVHPPEGSAPDLPPASTSSDHAVVIFSSGTTGAPKGVVHTHRNIVAELASMCRAYGVAEGMKHALQLPLSHVSGLYRSLLMPLCSGGTIMLRDVFEPRTFWLDIEAQGVEFVQLVPSHIALLNRSPEAPPGVTKLRLKFVGTASAYLPPKEQLAFENRFKVPILQGYGLTECTCGIALNSLDPSIRRPGVVGLPLDVNEIRIVDSDGIDVDQGEIGELWVRGPNVAQAFLGFEGPDFFEDWLKTGDLGRVENDGNIVLVGRRANVINRGAYKVYALEIEEALSELPGVSEAAVVGVPHPVLGQDIIAFVKLDMMIEPAQLLGALRSRISSFKIPSQIVPIEKMPQNHLGKIVKPELLSIYERRCIQHTALDEVVVVSRLCRLVADIFSIDINSVHAASSRESMPQWDSLGHVQVIAGIEQAFGVRIENEAAAAAQSLGELAKVIVNALGRSAGE